jgi:hypothetical protein
MSKSTFFTGQPILSQLLSLIPRYLVEELSKKHQADHYCKRFKAYDHVVTMLYTVFSGCSSIREVITGLMASEGRLSHLGLTNTPRRSTLSDANNRRSEAFFGDLYHALVRKFYPEILPDSYQSRSYLKRLLIIDSTTISLFSQVMHGTGNWGLNGKKKGGAKAHVVMKSAEDIPGFVHITEGIGSDKKFITGLTLPQKSIVVFDGGYNKFDQFRAWDQQQVSWITRIGPRTVITNLEDRPVEQRARKEGIISDQYIMMGGRGIEPLWARLIKYQYTDPRTKKIRFLSFITNNRKLAAVTIARIYQRRWQIEILFKRLKQNFPLKYFLGDSPNAIKIQIWCAFIADLLLMIVKDKVERLRRKRWAFANLASLVRLHLGTYIDLVAFLVNPEKSLLNQHKQQENKANQMLLFSG